MLEGLVCSLGLTLVFELAYAFLWGVGKKDLLLVAGMNVLTNPLVVLWNYGTSEAGVMIAVLLPEAAAIAVEAFLLIRFGKEVPRPVLLAVCINVFSFFLGLLIQK